MKKVLMVLAIFSIIYTPISVLAKDKCNPNIPASVHPAVRNVCCYPMYSFSFAVQGQAALVHFFHDYTNGTTRATIAAGQAQLMLGGRRSIRQTQNQAVTYNDGVTRVSIVQSGHQRSR